jgi:lysophospholipase L1-like esterase
MRFLINTVTMVNGPGGAGAAAGGGTVYETLQTDSTFDATDLTTYTFTGRALGAANANRWIVIGMAFRAGTAITVTSVTCGGVTLTKDAEARNTTAGVSGASLYSGPVPNGTTGDVVVTFSGAASRCGISIYASNTIAGVAYNSGTGTRAASAGDMTAALSSWVDRGVIIGAAYSAAGNPQMITSAARDYATGGRGQVITLTTASGANTWDLLDETADTTMETGGAAAIMAMAVAGYRYTNPVPVPMPTEILMTGRVNGMGFGGLTTSNGTNTGSNSRISCFNETQATVTSVKAHFGNYRATTTSEVDGANSITIRCALEYPAGVFTAMNFAAVRDKVMTAGSHASTDATSVSIPPDAQYWIRTYVTVTSGQTWPLGYVINGARGEACDVGTGTSDLTTSGTITGSSSAFGPESVTALAFTGNPINVAVATVGDSITAGSGDGTFDVRGGTGWNGRGAYNRVPTITFAVGGTTVQANVASNFTRRLETMRRAKITHVVVGYGVNDLNAGRTSTQVLADLQTLWDAFNTEGWRVYQNTITPKSSGAWSNPDYSDQTPQLMTHRPPLNTAIRLTPSPLQGYLEMADAVEPSRDSGLWVVRPDWANVTSTGDGLHPNNTNATTRQGGHWLMYDVFVAKLISWVNEPA